MTYLSHAHSSYQGGQSSDHAAVHDRPFQDSRHGAHSLSGNGDNATGEPSYSTDPHAASSGCRQCSFTGQLASAAGRFDSGSLSSALHAEDNGANTQHSRPCAIPIARGRHQQTVVEGPKVHWTDQSSGESLHSSTVAGGQNAPPSSRTAQSFSAALCSRSEPCAECEERSGLARDQETNQIQTDQAHRFPQTHAERMWQQLQDDNRRLVEIAHEQNDSIDTLRDRLRSLETAAGRSHAKLAGMRKEAAAARSSLDWTTIRLGAAEGAMMRYVGKKLDLDPSILQSRDQMQVTREFWEEHGYDMSQGDPVIIRPNSNDVARGLVDSDSEDVSAWIARTPPSVIPHEDQPVPYGFE